MKITLAICLLTLFINYAFACDVELPSNVIDRAYLSNPQSENCEFLKDSISTIENVNSKTGLSADIILHIRKKYNGAFYDNGLIVEVPQRLILREPGLLSPQPDFGFPPDFGTNKGYQNNFEEQFAPRIARFSVIAHEYGHAIFSKALAKRFEVYQKIRTELTELSIQTQEAYSTLINPRERLKELNETTKEFMQSLSKEERNFYQFSLTYSELFADLIAVYTIGSKDAMAETFYIPGISPRDEESRLARSFAPIQLQPRDSLLKTEHAFFYKVRQFIGKSLWPETPMQTPIYVSGLSKVILDDMEKSFVDHKDASNQVRNELLIHRIKEAFHLP